MQFTVALSVEGETPLAVYRVFPREGDTLTELCEAVNEALSNLGYMPCKGACARYLHVSELEEKSSEPGDWWCSVCIDE